MPAYSFERFANNKKTALSSGINSSGNSIPVLSTGGFPTPPFRVLIDNEILRVTGFQTGVTPFFMTERAKEGTSGTSHASGTMVIHTLTKESFYAITTDNSVANFALSSSSTNPDAKTIGNTVYLLPKNGNSISLIDPDPSELVWRTFFIDSASPSSITVTENAGELVDVFAYYNTATQKVDLYKTAAWTFDNPGTRSAITRVDGVLVLSANNKYRYLNTYQVYVDGLSVKNADFGWKRLTYPYDAYNLYHNNFKNIIVNAPSGATIRRIERGIDMQRICFFNGYSGASGMGTITFYPNFLSSGNFSTIYCPDFTGVSYDVQMSAGTELVFDAAFDAWRILNVNYRA